MREVSGGGRIARMNAIEHKQVISGIDKAIAALGDIDDAIFNDVFPVSFSDDVKSEIGEIYEEAAKLRKRMDAVKTALEI
jgi:hypothetical protein